MFAVLLLNIHAGSWMGSLIGGVKIGRESHEKIKRCGVGQMTGVDVSVTEGEAGATESNLVR